MDDSTYTAFSGSAQIAAGSLEETLRQTKQRLNGSKSQEMLLIFQDRTGKQIDFDLRGSIDEVLGRLAPIPAPKPVRTGPGRPRLGVTSREVSLLPRHWEWLETQPNGASATLRRLVDEERKRDPGAAARRAAIDAAGRVMTALAGNLPGFEEAYRALYAHDREGLEQRMRDWPPDVRKHLLLISGY